MLRSLRHALIVVLVGIASLLVGCTSSEVTATRKLPINHVDLQLARNGTYQGEYTYGKYTYVVEVTVEDHRIDKVVLLKNRDTKHAKMAEEVVGRVLSQQRNDVDAVTGATTTSKALLKAIEDALMKSVS